MTYYKELGKKLREHHEAIDDKVERIDKYQKYTNTELNYVILSFIGASNSGVTNVTINKGEVIPFNKAYEGGIEYNLATHTVKLKAKNSYRLLMAIKTMDTISSYCFYNETTGKFLPPLVDGATGNAQNVGEYVYTPEIDCEISIKMKFLAGGKTTATLRTNWYQSDATLNLDNSYVDDTYFIVQEIGRQIVIDPVEHVNNSQGIEDTPVGHIIAHMGTVAPKHYLICDGTEYNITDYPYLAQHIEDNFGSINFFGGDGTTTFAVPDLRGEFLRGTGTATRNTGSGAEIGEHQDGTQSLRIQEQNGYILAPYHINSNTDITNADKIIPDNNITQVAKAALTNPWTPGTNFAYYTSRPTNTAVLYCIKYEPTYFMNTYNTNYMQPSLYSEEERVIGCWIDGKPLYQKTIQSTIENNVNTTHGIQNIDHIVDIKSIVHHTNGEIIPDGYYNNQYYFSICASSAYISFRNCSGFEGFPVCITIQYTKTTDQENSFTNDMLKDSYVELTYSDEEISTMVSDILGGEE